MRDWTTASLGSTAGPGRSAGTDLPRSRGGAMAPWLTDRCGPGAVVGMFDLLDVRSQGSSDASGDVEAQWEAASLEQ